MKKVLLITTILVIVATSIFALVACGPADPNAFIEAFIKADEFTVYAYKDGNESVIMSMNKKGELCMPILSLYLIKEGDKMALYSNMIDAGWSKKLINMDFEEYLDYIEKINSYKEVIESEKEIAYVKDDNGFWFIENDESKDKGVKIEGGKFVMYQKINDEYVKISAISLKANIKLPEGAADAQVNG